MRLDPRAILADLLVREPFVTGRAVLTVYGQAPGGLLANGLAFAALFTVVPVALVTLGIAGLLVNDPTIQSQLAVVQRVARDVEREHGAAAVLTNLGRYQDSKHLHVHVSSGEPLR